MNIETELKEIRKSILEISRKLDELIYERQIISMMKLSEKSLQFLNDEPDIYKIEDLRVKYK